MYFVMPRSKLSEISAILMVFRIFRREKLHGNLNISAPLHSKYLNQAPNSSSGFDLYGGMCLVMPRSKLPEISAILVDYPIFRREKLDGNLNISAPLHSKYLNQAPNSSSGFDLSSGMCFVMPRSKLPEISAILVDYRIFRREKLDGNLNISAPLHSKYLNQAPNSSSGFDLSSGMCFVMPRSKLPEISAILVDYRIFRREKLDGNLNISAPLHSKYLNQAPNSSSGYDLSSGMYFVMPRSKLPEISAILVDYRIFRREKLHGNLNISAPLRSKYLNQAPNSSSGFDLSSGMYFVMPRSKLPEISAILVDYRIFRREKLHGNLNISASLLTIQLTQTSKSLSCFTLFRCMYFVMPRSKLPEISAILVDYRIFRREKLHGNLNI